MTESKIQREKKMCIIERQKARNKNEKKKDPRIYKWVFVSCNNHQHCQIFAPSISVKNYREEVHKSKYLPKNETN